MLSDWERKTNNHSHPLPANNNDIIIINSSFQVLKIHYSIYCSQDVKPLRERERNNRSHTLPHNNNIIISFQVPKIHYCWQDAKRLKKRNKHLRPPTVNNNNNNDNNNNNSFQVPKIHFALLPGCRVTEKENVQSFCVPQQLTTTTIIVIFLLLVFRLRRYTLHCCWDIGWLTKRNNQCPRPLTVLQSKDTTGLKALAAGVCLLKKAFLYKTVVLSLTSK